MRDPMPIIDQKYTTGNGRYKAAEIYTPKGVVLHSIGVPQPKAQVLRDSWQRNASQYVTHYVLDDSEIIQCMPNNFKCWHVGSPGNGNWIGIEMCEPKQIKYTSGAKFTVSNLAAAQRYAIACYKNAVWLIALLCKNYGWNPYTAILTHGEVTKRKLSNTDHVDPEHLWDGLGLGYDLTQLRADVAAAMLIAPQEPDADDDPKQLYRIRKAWGDVASQIGAYAVLDNAVAACEDGYAVFDKDGKQVYPFKKYAVRVSASALNIRKGPSTRYPVVQTITNGGVYTVVEEINGWGLLKAYEKARNGWVNLTYTERI
jgi:uncharacterized protein YraI